MELQYCRLPEGSPLETILCQDQISHWKNDSLYVFGEDLELFTAHYGKIITGGTYSNQASGPIDLCGINFYTQRQVSCIIETLRAKTPPSYEILLQWLQAGKAYIGFYLLGV